jgi:transcriptional regulator with XRE-family HTH domain
MRIVGKYTPAGYLLRQTRRAADLTQAEVAEQSGVALKMVGNYERGILEPTVDTFLRLLAVTGHSIDIVDDRDSEFVNPYANTRKFVSISRFTDAIQTSEQSRLDGPVSVPFEQKIMAVHENLEAANIEHAFSGAIALAFHTLDPRTTDDIDLHIAADSARVLDVLRALPPQIRWDDVLARIAERQGGVKLRWMRETAVDLFFPRNEHHRIVKQRIERYEFCGAPLPVVSATDLTVFKVLFDRPQDWADIDAMLRAGKVDSAEALRWVDNLGGEPASSKLRAAIVAAKTPQRRSAFEVELLSPPRSE